MKDSHNISECTRRQDSRKKSVKTIQPQEEDQQEEWDPTCYEEGEAQSDGSTSDH